MPRRSFPAQDCGDTTACPSGRYARSGTVSIAYQILGEGTGDLVLAFPFVSHLDLLWDNPSAARFRRGVGLSDPADGAATLEQRMDDVRAVVDAAGSDRTALLGMSEGATMCMLFAATYPERTTPLVLWGWTARSTAADDYPWAVSKEAILEANEQLIAPYWGQGATIEIFSPSVADDPHARELQARFERQAASPLRVWQLFQMFLDTERPGARRDRGVPDRRATPPRTAARARDGSVHRPHRLHPPRERAGRSPLAHAA